MSHFLIKLSMSAAQLPTRHLIVFATSNIRSTAGRFAVLLKLVIQATTTRWRSITRLQFSLRIQKYLSLTVADNGGDSIGVIHGWFDCVCVSKNTNISQLNGADHHMITHLRLYISAVAYPTKYMYCEINFCVSIKWIGWFVVVGNRLTVTLLLP